MKSHPPLLARDCLARIFVEASRSDVTADRALRELGLWAGGAKPGPTLCALRTEDGAALFQAEGGLTERFALLADWVRDRARRFEAARSWIREGALEGDALECARAAWDAGLFFEVHELLEPAWIAEPEGPRRQALQALIMAGGALHHLSEGNRAGALGLLAKSAARLVQVPDALDLDLESFARGLETLAVAVDDGRVQTIGDVKDLPRLEPRP